MKTLSKFATTVAILSALTGCASTGGVDATTATNTAVNTIGTATNIGTAVFQTAVNQKCQSEIKSNQYYKLASFAMTSEQQTKITESVCGCVSKKAPQSVSLTDMATAAIDSTARTQVVTKAVSNTLQACVTEFVK